jgi:hypothetical protein
MLWILQSHTIHVDEKTKKVLEDQPHFKFFHFWSEQERVVASTSYNITQPTEDDEEEEEHLLHLHRDDHYEHAAQ